MKRFYKMVTTHRTPDGFEIHLDGKAVQTPLRHVLQAPNQTLADLVMREWAAQEAAIKPETMPLTQILSTKIDRVRLNRPAMHDMLMAYLDTDLICYYAAAPPALYTQQKNLWQPVHDVFAQKFGLHLKTTQALCALTQDQALHQNVSRYVKNLDDNHFTAVQLICALSGSLALSLAFLDQEISVEDLLRAIYAEEDFKTAQYRLEKYGLDPESEHLRTAKKKDIQAVHAYLTHL
jgi:chaperone required for assembly of F1-ATPase